MTAWVKFHEELTQGAKRALPRAARFVFMELSLKCRPGRGRVELRPGVPDLVAVHELLGSVTRSDKIEVSRSLELLTFGDDPCVVLERHGESLALIIPSWEAWNAFDKSAERMRKLRSAKKTCDANVTRHGDGSVTVRDGARGEERRIEEIPPKPPLGGGVPAAPESERVRPNFRRVL